MDAVSYSLASKQAQRIEKFIENPDSTSGIVTVPKTIASGETITIPAGRVAVLPNVVVDGTLNIDGEVFIPGGSTFGDLDAQIALKADIASPALTGTPTAPTQSAQDNSTKLATTAYVDGKMVRGTAVASTSGTSIDFTGIPSWAKRITIMFNGVSTNGASLLAIRLGHSSTSIQISGYSDVYGYVGATNSMNSNNSCFPIYNDIASDILFGNLTLNLLSGNIWTSGGVLSWSTRAYSLLCSGAVTLPATLDRIRITTVNGTDTFDAGSINIMYEG